METPHKSAIGNNPLVLGMETPLKSAIGNNPLVLGMETPLKSAIGNNPLVLGMETPLKSAIGNNPLVLGMETPLKSAIGNNPLVLGMETPLKSAIGNKPKGCDPGYRGKLCEDTCSTACAGKDNSCNQTDGTCTQGCDPGYRGRFCQSKCESSTWGENCSLDCSTECVDRSCHHVTGMCTCWPGFWNLFCGEATVQLGTVLGGAVLVLTVCVIIGGTCVRRSVQYWVCVLMSWSSPCVSSLAVHVSGGQYSTGSVCSCPGPHRVCHHWRCMCQEVSTVLGLCVHVLVLTVCVIIGGTCVRRSVQYWVCVYQSWSSPCVSSLAVYVSGGQYSTESVCTSPCSHRLCHHWRHLCKKVSSVLGLCVSVLVFTMCVVLGGVCVKSPGPHRVCHHWRCMCQEVSSVLGLYVSVLFLTVCVIIGGVCVKRSVQFWVCVYQSWSSPCVSSLAVYVLRGQFSPGSVCISPGPQGVCHHWRCMCQEVSSVLGLCVHVLVLTVCVIIGGVCVKRSVQFWVCVYQSWSSPSVSSLAAHESEGQFSSRSVCTSSCPDRLCHHWRHMSQEVSSVLGLCVPDLVLTVCVIIGGT
ncbi:hypothetical protein RRG08_064837 [Elysia crispata]|uniref:EGF-like domain-containing protein n=1 Tax=Elysia crispata TaxID=231223 RepID=A0AAE0Z2W3_9GAST|nr:hypothetical protein RRG08_064837 [Elysia crispata]